MSNCITFIGDPGPSIKTVLTTIRESGLTAKRIESADHAVSILDREPPAAVILDGSLRGTQSFLEELRETRSLASIPVIMRLPELDPVLLSDGFRWGMDDFVIDGNVAQFAAFIALLGNKDSWNAVRAPAGEIILAHEDRQERAKFGRVLRRNGFDTYFAGSSDELVEAMQKRDARAVIASCDLPGTPPAELILEARHREEEVPPAILVCGADGIDELRRELPEDKTLKYFETGTDPEGVTFVLNELLAPPPIGARRSSRILWAAPATFRISGNENTMTGYTFNINLGGIYIRTLTSLPLQTKIEVSFRPPFGRGEVFVDAQVVWRKQMGDTSGAASPPGMGLQFLDLWPADAAAYETGYQQLLDQTTTTPSAAAPHPAEAV